MPAPHGRHPARFTLLATTAVILALPGAALAAKETNPLAGMTLDSVTATLTINTSRCPVAGDPLAKACGHTELESEFTGGPKVSAKRIAGGLRLSGTGTSQCKSESPAAEPESSPLGLIDTGTAVHYSNSAWKATDLRIRRSKRGTRWTWAEPSKPTVPCNYFYGEGDTKAPEAAVSQFFTDSTLKKKRSFKVTLETAANKFEAAQPDGSFLYGEASWKLVLGYKRYAVRK